MYSSPQALEPSNPQSSAPSFSLYLHIPYCQAKCPYCDFNSYAATQWPEQAYVDALCSEMRHYAQLEPWRSGSIRTIFFGGGTPSLFAPRSLASVLASVVGLWPVAADVETTLEANPGTISAESLRGFRAAGVNRMSFGVQSFVPRHLQTLGRIHGAQEARDAVRLARAAGFDKISVDLIFALPQQTLEEWESDLAEALQLETNHISAYNLTYEEGTPFHQWRKQGRLQSLPDEIEVAMFTRTQEVLGAAGFEQYEVSNYARFGHACRHNLNYWHSGSYLGVGAGAHSYAKPGQGVQGWGERWGNEKSPGRYMELVGKTGAARATHEELSESQARGEFMFLGLRCRDGIDATQFRARFQCDVETAFPHLEQLRSDGLLQCDGQRWQLSPRGLLLGDSVFATFL
ncbi:MAG: radical SAM family heme chaperone HemW [Deltaproteobacteria bacterium]|nr:radical SAM family heme chaperone HemW [Deltaproteobacteria bacterium]